VPLAAAIIVTAMPLLETLAGTAGQPPTDREEYWRHALARTFVRLESAHDGVPPAGRLRAGMLNGLRLAEVTGSAQVVVRDRAMVRREDPEFYKIGLQVRGRGLVTQDDREAVLGPGDFAAYDTSRPYRLAFAGDFQMLVLMCPRTALPVPEGVLARMTAIAVSGRDGVGALVSPFLAGLARAGADHAGGHLAAAALDLLAAALITGEAPAPTEGQRLSYRIQRYIDAHLADESLGPESVARAHHISVRYLHKLFERDGETVAGWIRARRLERCRQDLVTEPRDRTVSAIAARWGLSDAPHFSKAFRAAYGLSPRDYRRSLKDFRDVKLGR
jgi:AraC-like DNA-binding protein